MSTFTFPESWTLNTFRGDLQAGNIKILAGNLVFGGANLPITNSARGMLIVDNALINTGGVWGYKSPYTATDILSTLIDIFLAKNTKLYLGYYAYVETNGALNCGSQQIKAVADPTLAQDVSTKAYTDATVNVQKLRVDSIMAASTTDADSFAEIVTSVNAVAATGATNLLTATASIQTENTAQNVRITALELQVNQLYQKLYQKTRTETIL